jgi:hypothetical protein
VSALATAKTGHLCTLAPISAQLLEPRAAQLKLKTTSNDSEWDLELENSHLDLLNGSTLHLISNGDLEVRSVWCYCLARKGVSQVAPNAPQ